MKKYANNSVRALGLATLMGVATGLIVFLGLLGTMEIVLGQEEKMINPVDSLTIHSTAPDVVLSTTITGTLSYTHHFYFPVITSNHGAPIWTWLGPVDIGIRAIVCDPSVPETIYLGTNGVGIYKSTDGGESWMRAVGGLVYGQVMDLAIDPITPTTVYAATFGGDGVQKTMNGGDSWHHPQDSIYPIIGSLAIDPTNTDVIYAGSIQWEANGGWIFKSQDGGATWKETSPEFTNAWGIVVDWQAGSILYAGTEAQGVIKSVDSGQSWLSDSDGLESQWINALVIDPSDPNVLYAGTKNGVFKSTDGAASWITVSQGLTSFHIKALAIDPSDPTTIYAGTKSGIFKSTSGGSGWMAIGLSNLEIWSVAVDPFDSLILYVGTSDGAWRYGPPWSYLR